MTASLQTFTIHYVNLGNSTPLNVYREPGPNGHVILELGNGHRILGNRPEDFKSLLDAATKALEFFQLKTEI